MKKLLTALALTLMATPTLADSKISHETCDSYGQLANTIMKVRQQGAPMSSLLAIVVEGATEAHYELVRSMVIAAYKIPQYSTDDSKQREIEVFTNEVLLICYDR